MIATKWTQRLNDNWPQRVPFNSAFDWMDKNLKGSGSLISLLICTDMAHAGVIDQPQERPFVRRYILSETKRGAFLGLLNLGIVRTSGELGNQEDRIIEFFHQVSEGLASLIRLDVMNFEHALCKFNRDFKL